MEVTVEANRPLKEETEAQSIWEVWVAEPLTKDAETLLRWSKTTFFAGCPKPRLVVFGGKECSLFMRSSDRDFALGRLDIARRYYMEVRLTRDGKEIGLELRSKDASKPSDDLLGGGSSLCGGSC
jgi:hypothetical protein